MNWALVTIFMALANYTDKLKFFVSDEVFKTSAILEKAIPVILFQTKFCLKIKDSNHNYQIAYL